MGYVNNPSVAQDLAQETFITVWQQLPKFREEANVGTWIFRIASNNCLRQIERDVKFKKTDIPVNLPDEQQHNNEPQLRFLYECIAALPETDRIIISLELEDVKQSEIARITGLSETNVRVKIFRIKEKLTQKFRDHGH